MIFAADVSKAVSTASIFLVKRVSWLKFVGGENLLVRMCRISISQQIVLGCFDDFSFSMNSTVCR